MSTNANNNNNLDHMNTVSDKSTTRIDKTLSDVSNVRIDDSTRFNYILMKISTTDATPEKSKYILRGYECGKYHSDIFKNETNLLDQHALRSECVGGGRIDHDKDRKMMLVYGTSMEYDMGDHELAAEMLRECFPDYNVRFTSQGY